MYLPIINMYNFKIKDKVKNSILLSVALIMPSVFLSAILIGLPIALIWSSLTKMILLVTFALFGFAAYTTAIQCYGVFAADNYTTILYQNLLYIQDKERRRAANVNRKPSGNKKNKKKGKR